MEILDFDLLYNLGSEWMPVWLVHLENELGSFLSSFSPLLAFQCIEAMQVCLTQDQLVVEWRSSAPAVDTWMVEWFPDLDSEPSTFSWESVSQTTNWTIKQGSNYEPYKFPLCGIQFHFHQF